MGDLQDFARSLCRSLFGESRIEHVRAHRIRSNFVVAEHVHPDLLQFDWVLNCRGRVSIAGVDRAIEGCTFLLVPPTVRHAMSLDVGGEDARVYHIRIALEPVLRKQFKLEPQLQSSLASSSAMESALVDVWRLTVGSPERSLVRLARLAEAVALWPGAGEAQNLGDKPTSGAGIDRDLDASLRLMEQSLLKPPTLDELADAAHLSVRHFTRRFRATFGIAPIEYLDRKRLALAQQMLAYESSGIGDVAKKMHFSSPATFSRWFGNLAGESPTIYRARPHTL